MGRLYLTAGMSRQNTPSQGKEAKAVATVHKEAEPLTVPGNHFGIQQRVDVVPVKVGLHLLGNYTFEFGNQDPFLFQHLRLQLGVAEQRMARRKGDSELNSSKGNAVKAGSYRTGGDYPKIILSEPPSFHRKRSCEVRGADFGAKK